MDPRVKAVSKRSYEPRGGRDWFRSEPLVPTNNPL